MISDQLAQPYMVGGFLDLCPDQGRPTVYGWWAPVTLRYKERWGSVALFRRLTEPQSLTEIPNPI